MKIVCVIFSILLFSQTVTCRDFYIGMFKRDDFLVAQDVIFKEASPFGYTMATYGRLFKCPITFFRVVDRLGMGRGPFTTIVRGGLRKKYINVRIRSTYKLPVSVNIYVGCENKKPRLVTFPTRATTVTSATTIGNGAGASNSSASSSNGTSAKSETDTSTDPIDTNTSTNSTNTTAT